MSISDQLAKQSFVLVDGFIDEELRAVLFQEAATLRSQDAFKRAGIGRDGKVQDSIRRDEICWLDPQKPSPPQSKLFKKLEDLRLQLNQELYLGLKDFECHYAYYPGGAFYQKHIDQFKSKAGRTISLVLYLNPDWKKEDQGELKLYLKEREELILPLPSRMVCFVSSEVEHEVLAPQKERFSIACWFRR